MSESDSQRVRDLERRLREAEQRAEHERMRADEERKRAEEERKRNDQLQQAIRPTTLDEYMTACHVSLFTSLTIETNPLFWSKGSITIPRDKWCPTTLRPWSDFLHRQRCVFGLLYETWPANERIFESRNVLAGLGKRLSQRPVANERGLEYFLHLSVEDPVRTIVNGLKSIDKVRNAFSLGDGIIFENHPHAISDASEEVIYNEKPSTPDQPPDMSKLRPDQICVFRSDDAGSSSRTMLYVSEYKPPHKLTAPHLRLGLREPLNVYTDVVHRKTIPTDKDPEGKFQYQAELLTASAMTQTYHYMIEGGLEYGLLATGEMTVFLHVDWENPGTLLYHLAEPGAEAAAHPNELHLCSAVGQCLSFSLMALEGSVHPQEERRSAMAQLETWTQDFDTLLMSIPLEERHAAEGSPGFQPVSYAGVDRSPYYLRRRRRAPTPDRSAAAQANRGSTESSDDDGVPDTPSPVHRRLPVQGPNTRRSERIQSQQSRGHGDYSSNNRAEYCTQKCLSGLVRGLALDLACPNVALHQRQHESRLGRERHALDHAQFLDLLWKQLKQSLDHGITPLEDGGARGVLFRITLLGHGYTFVAKGTVRAFVKCLEHEAAIYRRLQALQGVHVPVFLGAIDLRTMDKIYYFAHRVYVIHMTFMSWGGHGFHLPKLSDAEAKELEAKALRSLRAIHGAGVAHRDVRAYNMLVNEEVDGVMMIDFERALVVEPPRIPLAQMAQSKRKRMPEATSSLKPTDKASAGRTIVKAFAEETSLVGYIFGKRQAC